MSAPRAQCSAIPSFDGAQPGHKYRGRLASLIAAMATIGINGAQSVSRPCATNSTCLVQRPVAGQAKRLRQPAKEAIERSDARARAHVALRTLVQGDTNSTYVRSSAKSGQSTFLSVSSLPAPCRLCPRRARPANPTMRPSIHQPLTQSAQPRNDPSIVFLQEST